jgi:selenocysteine lyase/cysteine desulfurase
MPRRAKAAVAEALIDREFAGEKRTAIREEREIRTRLKIARLIGALPEEICLVSNTSEGMNIIAQGLSCGKGDNIVLAEKEHPANLLPWLNLERKGVVIKRVRSEYGKDFSDSLMEAVDDKTRAVAASFVGWIDGFRLDLAKIGRFCRDRKIVFAVDAIQGVGAADLDVNASQISFLACGGFKWLMSPNGTGFIYVRKELLPELESRYVSYLSVTAGSEALAFRIRLKDDATRFRLGSISDIGIAAMDRSLDMILRTGIGNIQDQIGGLNRYAAEKLVEKGYTLISDISSEHRSGILTFRNDNTREKYRALIRKGIIVSLRNQWIRMSPHFYNNQEDIDRMLDAL